jgi:hypothetical protein
MTTGEKWLPDGPSGSRLIPADWHLTQIHPLQVGDVRSGEPVRCSGCLWPATLLGPDIEWVSFSTSLFRGEFTDVAGAGGVKERLDDLRLCSECVAKAAMLVDPAPAKTYRDAVDEETHRLALELTGVVRATKDVWSSSKRKAKRIADLEAKRDGQIELRAAASAWVTSWDTTAGKYREARLRVWAWQRAADWGDEAAAEELVDERKRLDSATKELDALRTEAARLRERCAAEGLAGEAQMISDRLKTMQVQEDGND